MNNSEIISIDAFNGVIDSIKTELNKYNNKSEVEIIISNIIQECKNKKLISDSYKYYPE